MVGSATRLRRLSIGAVASASALALCLSGCGGSSSGAQTADGVTTLTWQAWSGSQTETDALDRLAEMVTEQNPDLRIELQTSTFPDYWTKITAQASGGDVGCIISVQGQRLPLIEQLMRPMSTDDLAAAGIDMSEFNPQISEALASDGEQLAVPYDFGPLVVFYNSDAFEEAGLDAPEPGWTVEDFETAATELSDDFAGGGYGFFPTLDQFTAWSLTRTGEQAVTSDGELDLENPAMAETFEWLQGLQEDGIAPELPATNDTATSLNAFMAGDVAMTVDGPWQYGNIVSNADFAPGLAPMPAGPDGSASQVGGSGYGVSQSCSEPEAAMRAVATITSEEALQYLGEIGRAYPARPAVADSWYTGDLADSQPALESAIENQVVQNVNTRMNQTNQLFSQYGIPAFNGQQDAPAFLSEVQGQVGS